MGHKLGCMKGTALGILGTIFRESLERILTMKVIQKMILMLKMKNREVFLYHLQRSEKGKGTIIL